MKRIVFEANRTAYSIDQLREHEVVTVEELMKFLEQFDADDEIILSHDNGYTYGSLEADGIKVYEMKDDPDEGEDDWEAVDETAIWAY